MRLSIIAHGISHVYKRIMESNCTELEGKDSLILLGHTWPSFMERGSGGPTLGSLCAQ